MDSASAGDSDDEGANSYDNSILAAGSEEAQRRGTRAADSCLDISTRRVRGGARGSKAVANVSHEGSRAPGRAMSAPGRLGMSGRDSQTRRKNFWPIGPDVQVKFRPGGGDLASQLGCAAGGIESHEISRMRLKRSKLHLRD